MSCLVVIAVQESNGALVGAEDLGSSFEDPAFANLSSSAMDTLNIIHSLSSSTSSLNDSPVDRRPRADPASGLSRRKHDASSSSHILLSRSHDHDDDLLHSNSVPAAKASSTLSESLADAFGSELASARTSDKNPTRGNSSGSGSSGRSSSNSRIKNIIIAGLQRPTTDESDLELVSRTGSGLPSTGMSMESSFTASTQAGSWQDTSPAVQESRSKIQSRNSPRPIPTRASSGTTQSSRSRLEMDLAEAAATPSPGSTSSLSTAGSQRDISISPTPFSPSPSHSAAIIRETPPPDSQDDEERATPLEHHSFYALGIHGQTSTESYAREIEESMSRTPPLDTSRSSRSSSLSTGALDEAGSGKQEATPSHDEDDADDAIESAEEQRDAAAAARHLYAEGSGSRKTKLGSDSESEDKTSSPLAPPSKVSSQASSEGEKDDHDESEEENENENENGSQSESEDDIDVQESTSSGSFATRPLSTASSSTLLTDDSFLSSVSTSTHDRGHGDDGDEDEDDQDGDEEGDGQDSPRLDSPASSTLTREERKQEQQRLKRRKRRLLVDDAKRKQEQLDRIKAQLELKDLGKIRQQVSFWEEKGVLEQKVVAVVEVEEEPEETEGLLQSKSEVSSSSNHGNGEDLQVPERQQDGAQDKTVVTQGKMADFTLAEPLSPGNSQRSGHDEPPKPAARKQGTTEQLAASESDLAVFLSDID
ncbi:hypothetical protein BGZ72_001301 [Mortierella alpina]|nr:hypothetical protein BGZ72_001301 [Mortierella alpina]